LLPILISKEIKPLSNILSDQQVYDIDVCLVKDPFTNEVNALVVFSVYSESIPSFWGMEAFRWDSGNNEFTPYLTTPGGNGNPSSPGGNVVPTIDLDLRKTAGEIGTSIRIDANDLNEFIIVFDNANQKVFGYTGFVDGSISIYKNGLNFNNIDPFFIDDGVSPDVSITKSNAIFDPYITYCSYIGSAGSSAGKLIVAESGYLGLKAIVPSPTYTFSIVAAPALLPVPNQFDSPRIASPKIDPSGIVTNKYTVVYNVIEGSSRFKFYIRGYTNDYGSIQTYNNGTMGPSLNITEIVNCKPVVTYDNNDQVWVGWLINNMIGSSANFPPTVIPYPSATDAFFPVVVKCDPFGRTLLSEYWEVPHVGTNFGSNNAIGTFAISGRNSSFEQANYYSYFNSTPNAAGITNLLSKSVNIFTATSLREISQGEQIKSGLNEFLNNNLNVVNLNFMIFDTQGKLIYSTRGSGNDILKYINSEFQELDKSIYLCNLYSADGKVNINEKLFPNK
jgi:hypothetical protein